MSSKPKKSESGVKVMIRSPSLLLRIETENFNAQNPTLRRKSPRVELELRCKKKGQAEKYMPVSRPKECSPDTAKDGER